MKHFIPSLSTYLIESAETLRKTNKEPGCLMLFLNHDSWDYENSYISTSDISYHAGISINETEPHCTIIYGIDNETISMSDLNEILKRFPINDMKLQSSAINVFTNKNFDVLKYQIDSPKLHELHKVLAGEFDVHENFSTYNPHVTISYLKPGIGKKYAGVLNKVKYFTPTHYRYSCGKYSYEAFF